MADLVTHAAVGLLLGRGTGATRGAMALAAAGAVLPDVIGRAPGLALRLAGLEAASWSAWLDVCHTPAGSLVMAALLSQAFEQRARAAGWLAMGAASHFGLDILQDHHGLGYRLLFPLHAARFELGWIGSESTTMWALPLGLLALAAWIRPTAAKNSE